MRFLNTYFFILIVVSGTVNAQNTSGERFLRDGAIESEISALFENITLGKTSEREKFDAIFTWVSQNISYNYNVYFSSQGAAQTNLKKVLKRRKAICSEYAVLMDTLCSLAGIHNVVIYGYAKDEIFDVNDSLYLDNHAWNAVKLDGLWYLYDVTWASGSKSYEYRWFSRLLIRIFERIKPKYKKKKIPHKVFFPGSLCKTEPAYHYKQRFFNRLLINLLSLFNLRVREVHLKETDRKFYLTDPKLFYITHYPDNPVWTLLENKTLRNFECDSSFYHLSKDSYKGQQSQGIVCEACDSIILKNEEERLIELKTKSFQSNRRNRFITSYCEFKLGTCYLEQAYRTKDALMKERLLNLSLTNFESCGESLNRCKKNIETDFLLQKKKNNHKKDLLLEDNKIHRVFLKRQAELILAESKNNKRLFSKIKAVASKVGNTNFSIPTGKQEEKEQRINKKMQKRLEKLHTDYQITLTQIDSINTEISSKGESFNMFVDNVVLRVWQKGIHYDSLLKPFRISSYYRSLLKDNYKKEIVEIRRLIPVYEKNYEYDLANNLFAPSKMAGLTGDEIIAAINWKCYLQKNGFRMAKELVKYGRIPWDSLQDLKTKMEEENRLQCCWLESRVPQLVSTYMGFDFLRTQQRRMEVVINFENSKERTRLYKIDNELKRRKRKYKNIVSNNSGAVIVKKRQIKTAKKKMK